MSSWTSNTLSYLFNYIIAYAVGYFRTSQWYILKYCILLPIWVHFWAHILLLKVIYGLFGARILPRKYIRAQNWTQLAQSNIRYFKMYHWVITNLRSNFPHFLLHLWHLICFLNDNVLILNFSHHAHFETSLSSCASAAMECLVYYYIYSIIHLMPLMLRRKQLEPSAMLYRLVRVHSMFWNKVGTR